MLRYEVKSITPPESILRAMQQQITAEREKRALIAKSEGEKQQEINVAEGNKQAAILKSEGEKQSAINKAQGEATAIRVIAEATASAVNAVAESLAREGGQQAANLKIAEEYINAFKFLARTSYFGQATEFDQQGRVMLPWQLRDVAGMSGDVDVLGQIDYLEIWNHERFLAKLRNEPFTDDDARALSEFRI